MKKHLVIILILLCCLVLCACGTQDETATPSNAPDGMTSTLPGANLKSGSTAENEEENPVFDLAQTYIDKSVDELISAIGEPKTREYSSSCLGDGEDGNLEYDGFYVYTYKENGVETVKEVYK